jgi:hypothetical protein
VLYFLAALVLSCAPAFQVAIARAEFAVTPSGDPDTAGGTTLSDGQGALTCEPGSAADTVQLFVESFNAGETGELDRLVAGPKTFLWYSTDEPGQRWDPQARDRSSLMSYFANRHAHDERLELTRFQFNGNWGGYGNFEFDAVRSADDGLPSTPYQGKGALDCATTPQTVAVWSMASIVSPASDTGTR